MLGLFHASQRFQAYPLARPAHLLQAQHAPQISDEDCAASPAFGGGALRVRISHRPKGNFSRQQRYLHDRSGNLTNLLAKPRPGCENRARFALRSYGCAYVLRDPCATPGCHCGEGGNSRKFPLASKGGNAIFATIVFQPIRVWGVGPAASEVKRGNAAWGRKNRHW